MLSLLATRQFLPFFLCQFFGAFNDNLFRLALVAMLSFGVLQSDDSAAYVQLAAALFMLPFFLFAALAGDIADHVNQRRYLQFVKAAECGIMVLAAVAVYGQNLTLLLFCLFLTGAQSAFFSPIKYALLPTLLTRRQLLSGNAWFSISTFAAILMGTIIGTLTGKAAGGNLWLSIGLIGLAAAGLATTFYVPAPTQSVNTAPPTVRPWRALCDVMGILHRDRAILHRTLAASWFWGVGALLLGELPNLGERAYGTLLIAILAGVSIGAFLCKRLLRDDISTRYAPIALLLSGLFLADVAGSFGDALAGGDDAEPSGRLIAGVIAFTAAMTVFVVPLRADIQQLADEKQRARIISGYNIYNALFIIVAALTAALLHAVMGDNAAPLVLNLACILTIAGVLPAMALLPIETWRNLLRRLCRRLFRVTVHGEEHLRGNRHVIVANHTSYYDAFLFSVFLESPEQRLCFAIDPQQAKRGFVRPLLKLVTAFPLNPMEPHSIRRLIKTLKNNTGLRPMIFPEGRITVTGNLMKSYPGAGVIAVKISDGNVVPVHIEGAQYSTLSRMDGKFRLRWFPTIRIQINPPRNIIAPDNLRGRQQRQWMANKISQILEESAFHARHKKGNITALFAERAKRHGKKMPLFAEVPDRILQFNESYRAAIALGGVIKTQQQNAANNRIGVLLPSSIGACITFYGAIFQALTPVLLNPSAGKRQVLSACRTAELATVYTSEKLLERSPPTVEIIRALEEAGIRIITLESLRPLITLRAKLKAVLATLTMQQSVKQLPGFRQNGDDAAVILFTSGSEGDPKGVVLSHNNLIANGEQILSRLDATRQDVMLNALPIFHSFGLMAGVIIPVMAGLPAWQYPSPLHYRLIPEIAYGGNATIFFSTDTFLYNYGTVAHPMDFQRLRLVFAGAEKLQERTRQMWASRFGVRLLEGYGVTETSPVIAFNAPTQLKMGTVGRLLPGMEATLQPMEGVARGGRLLVRGANIMRGYLLAQEPGVLREPADGWHDTGDITDIDEDGFISILGRAKRFIKVAGEMVPLDGIEERLLAHWSDGQFALVGLANRRRGEVLALMTTAELSRETIAAALREDGFPDLWTPRIIKRVKELPLLATGKVDYPAVTAMMKDGE